ncbi:methyltransferase [Desulfococcaceae bacterium HSG8]|nr:methyltransferase [Desulfococcaceae bacterium HSG8]
MESCNYELIFPKTKDELDQDQEWVIVKEEGCQKKIMVHDYDEIYKIPGLYEDLFYKRLGCDSPNVVCEMLAEEMKKADETDVGLRVFDFGAGNGIVGERIREMDCDLVVGVDIIPEAKDAARRDRPGIYDDYHVADLTDLNDQEKRQFRDYNFNTLVTVAALGFNDIPTVAFLNAFNLIDEDGWVAFNIRDKFLTENDHTGYRQVLSQVMDDSLDILQDRRYCHRRSLSGDELCYHAIVGKKVNDIDNLSDIILSGDTD